MDEYFVWSHDLTQQYKKHGKKNLIQYLLLDRTNPSATHSSTRITFCQVYIIRITLELVECGFIQVILASGSVSTVLRAIHQKNYSMLLLVHKCGMMTFLPVIVNIDGLTDACAPNRLGTAMGFILLYCRSTGSPHRAAMTHFLMDLLLLRNQSFEKSYFFRLILSLQISHHPRNGRKLFMMTIQRCSSYSLPFHIDL